jgi:hypothetical protein
MEGAVRNFIQQEIKFCFFFESAKERFFQQKLREFFLVALKAEHPEL